MYHSQVEESKSLEEDLVLIDFGMSKYYKDQTGEHLIEKKEDLFSGNLLFSSPNAQEFRSIFNIKI